jgi:uncharacterized protein YjbJ (UPF0337 family)
LTKDPEIMKILLMSEKARPTAQKSPSLKNETAAQFCEAELRNAEQQATGNRQQATGNRQQATGNRQQATGNRQQATGNIVHIF